jgi:hypothetical protein
MKTLRIVLMSAAVLLCSSCAKKKFYKQIMGTWTPYEIVSSDGQVTTEVPGTLTIFGFYAPGVEFRSNNIFVPFSWDNNQRWMKNQDLGTYERGPDKTLVLNGVLKEQILLIEKLEDRELWLRWDSGKGSLIKLKKD